MHERPLADNLGFGARINDIDWDATQNPAIQQRIKNIFEERGLIIFEDVEPTDKMQLALSNIIGPLQDLSLKTVSRVNSETMPGVVKFKNEPNDANIFEVNGKQLSGWISWHFDGCYTSKLNRGAVLRVVDNPPEGGDTGFVDGIQLYNTIDPKLLDVFKDLKILYHGSLMFQNQRYAMPEQFRLVRMQEEAWRVFEEAEKAPRSIHPAVWQRPSGENVLHVAPYQAAGIVGKEGVEGDSLLEKLFQEIYAKMTPYWHTWKSTDMVAWDNWRFIHSASGHNPNYSRCVHRTTIKGDYGLGALEAAGQ